MDDEDAVSFPKDEQQMYNGSLGRTRDMLSERPEFANKKVILIVY